MAFWALLGKVALLLACASVAGVLLRRIRQNAVIGYLLTGLVLGPSGLRVFRETADLQAVSELGVALLLFTIGTEFSLARLKTLGRVAVPGGLSQVAITTAAFALAGMAGGIPAAESVILASAISMSSTSVVLRVLTDRSELDSQHGRNAIGVLLFQDMAVVVLMLLVDAWGRGAAPRAALRQLGALLVATMVFGALLWLAVRFVAPRLLSGAAASGARELPVLVAACTALAAAWAAHELGFSPAIGAFVAGILIAESPFATQVRADLAPLSSIFVTLFFTIVGALVHVSVRPDILWILAGAAGVLVMKALLAALAIYLFDRSFRTAVATGLALAQVGEFSFVLAQQALGLGLIAPERFTSLLAVSLLTLVMTPYLVAAGPSISARMARRLPPSRRRVLEQSPPPARWRRVVIVGFGPAGQQVARALERRRIPFLILEMNPNTVAAYRTEMDIELGDATESEVLRHAGVGQAEAVVVTLPDPRTAVLVIEPVKRAAPGAPVIARGRYHQFADLLRAAGAAAVVDEEETVGDRLVAELISLLESHARPGFAKRT